MSSIAVEMQKGNISTTKIMLSNSCAASKESLPQISHPLFLCQWQIKNY